MKLGTPRWWYVRHGGPAPLTRALLTPISWLWADATRKRIARTVTPRLAACLIAAGSIARFASRFRKSRTRRRRCSFAP